MKTFAEIVGAWPSAVVLAADLRVNPVTARAWKARGIPAEYWCDIVQAAALRGISGVTLEVLARLAAERRDERPAELGPADAMPAEAAA